MIIGFGIPQFCEVGKVVVKTACYQYKNRDRAVQNRTIPKGSLYLLTPLTRFLILLLPFFHAQKFRPVKSTVIGGR
jgi:hypothetical protein